MGAIKNSGVFKGASVNGQIVKGLAKNGVAFWKQETLHAHTVKILARATAIGATAPTNIANFDAYVRSMYDIWVTYCDVFFRFRGTGDANFKRINLANPDGVLADFYGGYTLDISGIKGNGVNAYVGTNLNPSLLVAGQKYQLNDAYIGILVAEDTSTTTSNGTLIGEVTSSQRVILVTPATTAQRLNSNSSFSNGVSVGFTSTGLKSFKRSDSSNIVLLNKNIENTRPEISSALPDKITILSRAGANFGVNKISSAFFGKSVSFEISQLIRASENADMANLGLPQIA